MYNVSLNCFIALVMQKGFFVLLFLEMQVKTHHLQTIASLSRSWVFSIEIRRFREALVVGHNLMKVKSNEEDRMINILTYTSTSVKIKSGEIIFTLETVQDVYYKVTVSQIFWPTNNRYVRELRIDGVLQHRVILEEAKTYTNVRFYAADPAMNIHSEDFFIRNYYFLDIEEMAEIDSNPI